MIPDNKNGLYKNMNLTELFEFFFDENVINLLVEESMRYASSKNASDFVVTKDEIKCFLGILLVSGYNPHPGKRFYCDSRPDMNNQPISQSIRNRFFQIVKYIHCADNNNIDVTDKVYKLRPLMNLLKGKFLKHFIPEENLNYDESMVKYYGHYGCKQFFRGKPIRFGFKMWCINAASRYLLNFDMYQGKDSKSTDVDKQIFGKCTAPFISMLDEIEKEPNFQFNFYFDNLFISMSLLKYLRLKGYNAAGTE